MDKKQNAIKPKTKTKTKNNVQTRNLKKSKKAKQNSRSGASIQHRHYRSIAWAPPSAYSYKFAGTFSCAKMDSRKAWERDLAATFDENRRAVWNAEPYLCAIKIEGTYIPGGRRDDTWVPQLVQKLKSKKKVRQTDTRYTCLIPSHDTVLSTRPHQAHPTSVLVLLRSAYV